METLSKAFRSNLRPWRTASPEWAIYFPSFFALPAAGPCPAGVARWSLLPVTPPMLAATTLPLLHLPPALGAGRSSGLAGLYQLAATGSPGGGIRSPRPRAPLWASSPR